METPLTLTDVEALAVARMDPDWAEYLAGGAGAERTLAENVAAFASWRLRQRVLCGIDAVTTATTVLGRPRRLARRRRAGRLPADGAPGRGGGAGARGRCSRLRASASRRSRTRSPEEVAAAAPDCVRFLQVYVFRDHGVTDELIAEALDAGFSADLPHRRPAGASGSRDRERRIHWTFQDESLPAVRRARSTRAIVGAGLGLLDPALDWAYLERLASSVPVPVVVKGVLEPEDAVLAAEHGAAGVVVSNHGGRQLDGVMPTIEALPAIVDAVGDRLEVLLDGGIRRGTDVATALALGASAVLAGPHARLGARSRRRGGSADRARAAARGARGGAPPRGLPIGRRARRREHVGPRRPAP